MEPYLWVTATIAGFLLGTLITLVLGSLSDRAQRRREQQQTGQLAEQALLSGQMHNATLNTKENQ